MRIFLAGATGVIGIRLVPILIAAGHEVAGMTRRAAKVQELTDLGATPVVCDVFDAAALRRAVVDFRPEAVLHQLTDLPDDASKIPQFAAGNARIRREGTRNLLAAHRAAGATRFVAQSVAWEIPGDGGAATRDHEQAVLDAGGVVVRYGQLYGPGTYFEDERPAPPRIHVDDAARRTLPTLDAPSGVIVLVDD